MKKHSIIACIFMLFASLSHAATFSPNVMKLTAPEEIPYKFDGNPLTIPFTLTGTPASLWLVVATRNKADNIVNVRNGNLGWRYVNKIDTTVYISPGYSKALGEGTITWDGLDQDGAPVPPGEYTYYLWGYNDKNPRQPATKLVMIGYDWESQFVHVYEKDTSGMPLSRPLLMGAYPWWTPAYKPDFRHGTHFKWALGGNPDNQALLQTTLCAVYAEQESVLELSYGGPVFDPKDYSIFYHCAVNVTQKTDTMLKWEFIPGGEAILDQDWLGWSELTWDDGGLGLDEWSQKPSCYTDGDYIYVVSPGLDVKTYEWNKLRCVGFDGDTVFDKMMNDWYMPDDRNPGGYINGSFHKMASRGNNRWFLLGYSCCLMQMIDTTRLLDSVNDETDMVMFENGNGDYFLDSGYQTDAEFPWNCIAEDSASEVRRESIAMDANGFNIIGMSGIGNFSFALMTQDGKGAGYMAFADDVASGAAPKGGGLLVDSGSNYDGLYFNTPYGPGFNWVADAATYHCAFDSFRGVIRRETNAVEDERQTIFSVSQNTPNPFNPRTSITFTIPQASAVSVAVYNTAGQRAASLAESSMSAGTNTVVWNAEGFSAGVYFCTVRAGSFSKTIKMTLVK